MSLENEKNSIWNEILKEAKLDKEIEESHMFLFGNRNTGKKSLIKSINKELFLNYENENKSLPLIDENISKNSFVDYKYLNLKKLGDTENEILAKMNIWLINSKLDSNFLEMFIKPEYLLKSCIVVALDLSKPADIIDQLKLWNTYFYEKISSLLLKLPVENQQEMIKNNEDYFKLWEEGPSNDNNEENKKDKLNEEAIALKLEMPLKEGVLKVNLGIPVIYVVNKSDIVSSNNERKRYEEDSEFILKYIRKYANIYGASIIYTSTKTSANIQLLYEYLLHRIYKFEFTSKPNFVDKDLYFIPSGFDSDAILNSFDNNNELSKSYNERIVPSKSKQINNEEEIITEDTQQFLKKFYGQSSSTNKTRLLNSSLADQKLLKENSKNYIKTPSAIKLEKFKNQYTSNDTSNAKINSEYNSESSKTMSKIPSNSKFTADSIREKEMQAIIGNSLKNKSSVGMTDNERLKKKLHDLKNK